MVTVGEGPVTDFLAVLDALWDSKASAVGVEPRSQGGGREG